MKKRIASIVVAALALIGGLGLAPTHASARVDVPMPITGGDCEGGTVYWWGICHDTFDELMAIVANDGGGSDGEEADKPRG